MSRYFMYGTSLQDSERMMMSVPNFLPRTKGMIIMGKKTIEEKEEFKSVSIAVSTARADAERHIVPIF